MQFNKNTGIELIKLTIGCVLYALSVVLFIDPVHIIPGSVTGIGVVVKALTGFPIGMLSIIINVPLVIIGTIVIGKKLLLYTGYSVFLSSILIDAWSFMEPFTENVMLASIFGAVVMGLGLGLLLDAGGTTGGTTVVGRLILKKYPHIPMGNILLIGDFIIILVGSVLLRNWELLLYSLINLYICVIVINKVMYGFKVDSLSIIVTEKKAELENAAQEMLPCRIWQEESADSRTLMFITRKTDVSKLQRLAEKYDQQASCATFDLDYSFGEIK